MEPFIGQVILFAGNYAPRGWAFCSGQLLPIAQHNALFSILGTTYGGDGRTTFALPDLRGRVPIHSGQGPGLRPYQLGQRGGAEEVTLNTNEIPSHTHSGSISNTSCEIQSTLEVGSGKGTGAAHGGHLADTNDYKSAGGGGQIGGLKSQVDTFSATLNINPTGGSQPHYNMQPFCTLNYIIALMGTYPSRD